MESDRDRAIRLAQVLFRERQAQGIDMSAGPCLAEEIIPGWCVDVAHSPREEIDNLPEPVRIVAGGPRAPLCGARRRGQRHPRRLTG